MAQNSYFSALNGAITALSVSLFRDPQTLGNRIRQVLKAGLSAAKRCQYGENATHIATQERLSAFQLR